MNSDIRSSCRGRRSPTDSSIRVALLLMATIFGSRALAQDAKGDAKRFVSLSKATEQVSQAKDLVTDHSDKWKALYGNLSGECKQSLIKAVQQRRGFQTAIDLVSDSAWAKSVCGSADIRSSFYDGALADLDRLLGPWNKQGFVEAADLDKLNKAMLAWKQREQEPNTLVVRMIGHTADHALCYETHKSDDPICVASSEALEAEQGSIGKLAKFSLLEQGTLTASATVTVDAMPECAEIHLSCSPSKIYVKEVAYADIQYQPRNCRKPGKPQFHNDSPQIASLNGDTGRVVGLAEGKALIKVVAGALRSEATVEVTNAPPCTGIDISYRQPYFWEDKKDQDRSGSRSDPIHPRLTYSPERCAPPDGAPKYESVSPNFLVDANGVVTLHARAQSQTYSHSVITVTHGKLTAHTEVYKYKP